MKKRARSNDSRNFLALFFLEFSGKYFFLNFFAICQKDSGRTVGDREEKPDNPRRTDSRSD